MAVTQIQGGSQIKSATVDQTRVTSGIIRADGTNAFSANQAMGGNKLTGLGTPTVSTDAATKAYVDAIAVGLDPKASVRVATAAALPANTRTGNVLTASANGALAAIDGITLIATDRLLVKNEATGANNGIYTVTTVGDGANPFVLTRATDMDADAEATAGAHAFVEEGITNADSGWVLTTDNPITLNTTTLTFTQFTGAGSITAGAGLTKTGSTLDVVATNGSLLVNADDIGINYSGTPSTQAIGDSAAAGTDVHAARIDHKHAMPSFGSPGNSAIGDTASDGVATSIARADHRHGREGSAAPTTSKPNDASVTGVATTEALSDHKHARETWRKESFAGDASTTIFTLVATPAVASVELVHLNGLLMDSGAGNDYTISGAAITFLFTPASGDKIRVFYAS